MVKTCVIKGYGINAENELQQAFKLAGSEVDSIHITEILDNAEMIHSYDILAFPGGFSFGDHLGSGIVFAYLVKKHLKSSLEKFIQDGKLIIGICNGFQVLTKMGILPNLSDDWTQNVSLIHNDHGEFINKWVHLQANEKSPAIWTKNLGGFDAPIRHGEGRFYIDDKATESYILDHELIALQYQGENPNGSMHNIAGISDKTGQILGLMPHPEAYLIPENHPDWQSKQNPDVKTLQIFKNGVEYIRNKQKK